MTPFTAIDIKFVIGNIISIFSGSFVHCADDDSNEECNTSDLSEAVKNIIGRASFFTFYVGRASLRIYQNL